VVRGGRRGITIVAASPAPQSAPARSGSPYPQGQRLVDCRKGRHPVRASDMDRLRPLLVTLMFGPVASASAPETTSAQSDRVGFCAGTKRRILLSVIESETRVTICPWFKIFCASGRSVVISRGKIAHGLPNNGAPASVAIFDRLIGRCRHLNGHRVSAISAPLW